MNCLPPHVLAASPAIIYTCQAGKDFGGTYISTNLTDLLGYDPGEFLKDSGFWKAHVHPGDLPRVLAELETIFTSRHLVCEYRFRARDGSYRWVRDDMRLSRNPATGAEEIVGSWLDVTERRELEDKYRRIAGLTSEYVHYCTRTAGTPFRIRWMEGAIEAVTGYAPGELLAKGCWLSIVHPDDQQTVADHLMAMVDGDRKRIEFRIVTKTGRICWVAERSQCEAGESEGELGLLGAVSDITEQKRAERALRDNESYLRAALQIARLGRWRWNILTGELDWSTMMKEIFGLASLERPLTFADFAATVHPEDRSRVEATTEASLAGGSEFACEHRIVLADGSVRHILAKGKPFYDAAGKPTRMIGTALDVTDQKQVEADLRETERLTTEALQQTTIERDKTRAILEAMADGISIQDPELRILYQNTAHRNRMGEHLGEHCYRAYQQREEVCPGCHLVQCFADGQVHVREATAAPAGELRHFQIVSTPLFDPAGQLIAGIEAVRDITERKRSEEELQRKSTELEEANRELEAFSYTLSHDLRSYLARITLATESLQGIEDERWSDTERYLLTSILGTCLSMDELIATMLSLAQASRQEMQCEALDLSSMAEQICGELALANPDRIMQFAIAPGLRANGDFPLLQVALENLFGNACKYSREKAEARISLSVDRQDGNTIFAIADNGAGFDMAEADKLFRPFQRLSSARSFPGFGIGLATVQRIIRRHGGEIWAKGVPGKGATFYFTLPGQSG